ADVEGGGWLGCRQRNHSLARPSGLVRKPPRAPCAQQQRLAFTSEDESGAGEAEMEAEAGANSLVTNPSFEELPESALAWGLSVQGARRVARPATAGGGSTAFGRSSPETSPTKRALKAACGSAPELKSPPAVPTSADKKELDVKEPGGGESRGGLPRERSPAAAVADRVFGVDAPSLSLPLPGVKHTAASGGSCDAATLPQDGPARVKRVSSVKESGRKPSPPSGRNGAQPRAAVRATRGEEVDATVGESEALAPSAAAATAATVTAAVTATAAAAVVPSRPSAGGWFTSRRFQGADDLPRTPAGACVGDSPTSVGAGCDDGAPTPSPDLLAFRAGRRANAAATTAAAATAATTTASASAAAGGAARGRQGRGGSSAPLISVACEGRGAGGGASEEGVTASVAARRPLAAVPPSRSVSSELNAAVGGGEGLEAEHCRLERQRGKK
ncbi:unnamed protein product, partial [Laminaria digitata]